MISIENDSVAIHVKSIVYDAKQYGRLPVFWLAAVGSRMALQAIFASMVNKKTVTLRTDEERVRPRHRYYRGYDSEHGGHHIVVPSEGSVHVVYKKLGSGLSAMAMYSDLVKCGGEFNRSSVLLCKDGEDPEVALFHFLNSKIKIPMHESWKDWVWGVVSKTGREMRQLSGYGMVGFYLDLPGCEIAIEAEIGKAIKKGMIKA